VQGKSRIASYLRKCFHVANSIAHGRAWPFDETVTSPVSPGRIAKLKLIELELQTHGSKFSKLQGSL